jgi:heptosyltransferase-3
MLKPKPKRILVIVMRYLGDVLLATPLLRSLRIAYPDAQLDVLVYDNTAGILEGNNDIDNIIVTSLRISYRQYVVLLKRLFRRYDLAVVTQTGDRPFLYGLMAASFRIAVVPPKGMTGWWKRFFLQRWTEFDNEQTHTVLQNLKLLDLIGISKDFTLVPPQTDNTKSLNRFEFLSGDYVVLHPFPQWTYKRWTVEGWVEIGCYLRERGLKVVLSGGALQEELDYIAAIAQKLPADTVNLAGQTSLAQLSHILAQAKLYIGPDTGITHLAAATAVPVLALYGPTNPIKWSPWPYSFDQDKNPFSSVGCQKVNNVSLIQGKADCVPCQMEGCEQHRQSYSRCLDALSVEQVKFFVNQVWAG